MIILTWNSHSISAEVRALQLYLVFYIFICVLLKAESMKVVLIVVGDIVLVEVYCKGCEEDMVVQWRTNIGIGNSVS